MAGSAKKSAESSTETPADAVGADEVQERFDEANKQGFWGSVPDETPNENYTLQGVTSGKPTPETERGK